MFKWMSLGPKSRIFLLTALIFSLWGCIGETVEDSYLVSVLVTTPADTPITPSFNKTKSGDRFTYKISVPYESPEIVFKVMIQENCSFTYSTDGVKYNGGISEDYILGTSLNRSLHTPNIPLNVGVNTIRLRSELTSGKDVSEYIFEVTRGAARGLKSLEQGQGSFTPAFDPLVLNYKDTVDLGIDSVVLIPTAFDSTNTILVNGLQVKSGLVSKPIAIPYDTVKTVKIEISSADQTYSKTYAIDYYRASLGNVDLAYLKADEVYLYSSKFHKDSLNYEFFIQYPSDSVTFRFAAIDSLHSIVLVNGKETNNKSAKVPLAWEFVPFLVETGYPSY